MRRRRSSRSSSGTSTRKGRTAGWVSIGCTPPPVERLGGDQPRRVVQQGQPTPVLVEGMCAMAQNTSEHQESARTSQNSVYANFAECPKGEVRASLQRSIIVMPLTLERASPEEVW